MRVYQANPDGMTFSCYSSENDPPPILKATKQPPQIIIIKNKKPLTGGADKQTQPQNAMCGGRERDMGIVAFVPLEGEGRKARLLPAGFKSSEVISEARNC